ncbi:hypothetical protein OSTOST_07447 [Ostertagia ostertagi]
MLVIYITFLRFMVVMRPLRYASSHQSARSKRASLKQRRASMVTELDSIAGSQKGRTSLKTSTTKEQLPLREYFRSCLLPGMVIFLCFAVNILCISNLPWNAVSTRNTASKPPAQLPPVFRHSFTRYKAILMTLTQTVGPVATILILSVLTEYRVHRSLRSGER